MLMTFTHDRVIDCILPGVAPTGQAGLIDPEGIPLADAEAKTRPCQATR
jgi:hypothetical protein